MRRLKLLIGVLVAGAFMVSDATAAMRLTLSSGGSTVVINDNGAGDLAGGLGQIAFVGAVGNWNFNVTSGVVGNNPLIDLNSLSNVNGAGTGANALTLMLSATDYNGPSGFGLVSHIGGTLGAGHSLTYQAYVNPNNALDATQNAIGAQMNFGPSGAFSGTQNGGLVPAGLYSLTQVVTISATSIGGSSFDAAVNVTPEPASIVLLSGVALFVASRLRKTA